ncbi:uncharacterized protein BKA78DRAFT_348794 [Phyllosticta capitalensis]|uniref:uncharacterized protein n=1 Tax=Phyllosticta capitalensis TaxID=121624 RepID=UPI00312ECAF0
MAARSLFLLCRLALVAVAATVTPSNTTDASAEDDGIVLLVSHGEGMVPASTVAPLTTVAASGLEPPGRTGELFLATDSTAQNVNSSNIAYINCEPSAYAGNIAAADVLSTVIEKGVAGALFFSPSAAYCNVTGISSTDAYVYSMTDASAARSVLSDLENTSNNLKYFATIQPRANANNTDNMSGNNSSSSDYSGSSNPLGPSPSTAVAMIILYSITGVITALFLIIIITGALRAHRHPERYGAGVVLGGNREGQRQTRVRGLARAMLETIPIVKFGEQPGNQQNKPEDVEMGEARTRRSNEALRVSEDNGHRNQGARGSEERSVGETAGNGSSAEADDGIAAATPAASAENLGNTGGDVYTGCTICTDEFEPGEDIRVLPCDHRFHPACVDPWLLNVSGTCPLCRIDLHPACEGVADGNERRSFSDLAPPLSPRDAAAANITDTHRHRRNTLRNIFHIRPETLEERLATARSLRLHGFTGDASEDTAPPSRVGERETQHGPAGEERQRRRLSGLFNHGEDGGSRTRIISAIPLLGRRRAESTRSATPADTSAAQTAAAPTVVEEGRSGSRSGSPPRADTASRTGTSSPPRNDSPPRNVSPPRNDSPPRIATPPRVSTPPTPSRSPRASNEHSS